MKWDLAFIDYNVVSERITFVFRIHSHLPG